MVYFHMIWLLSYISIASFSATIITPALPDIQRQFGLLQGQVEWMVSAFLVGYVIGQLIYGPLANRFGRILALRTGLAINILGIILCLLGLNHHSFIVLLIGRWISALGAASGLACTFMLINEWLPPDQRKTATAYTILSFTLGIGVAVILGGIITEFSHWEYCFYLLLCHGLMMFYGTKIFSETLKIPQKLNWNVILNGYKEALSSTTLVIYSLVVGLCSAIGYCFSALGPQIAIDLFQLTPAEYGYWNLLNMAGMLAGGLIVRPMLQRWAAGTVVLIGMIGTALGLVPLFLISCVQNPSVAWFFSSTLTLYLFSGLLFAGGSLIASNSVIDKASGAAMMSFLNMVTATVSVICSGLVSYNPLIGFISVLGGLWMIVLFLLSIRISLNKRVESC
ncbi:MFS transporter [Legionella quateirensis]|uniref:Major facilitator superfamily (MFS) transporter n=1 Tax=Legionella quateirensis TaxID=45072 RepID=A0A378KVK4_9GAMM|nr:MFS transporter [Legionella quateirensis]KTD47642.1 major facilitator superfamily (MFS) transporter [Legionella quateirensis]STY18602.1 major facilitator superfamily (MFS) transporter [Legionella quateirensis]